MSQRSKDNFPDDPHDGPRPDPSGTPDPIEQESHDWLQDTYPLVDADFVGDTLDRVIHDRSEIESEAAAIDEAPFAPELLRSFPVPAPRPRFVEDTLRRVMEEQAEGRRYADDAEFEFHRLLESAQVPEPSSGFVDATLRAVMADRVGRDAAAGSTGRSPASIPIPIARGRRFSVLASAAAVILCSLLIFLPDGRRQQALDAPSLDERVPALTVTPVSWAALVNDTEPRDRRGDRSRRFVLPEVNEPNPVELFGTRTR